MYTFNDLLVSGSGTAFAAEVAVKAAAVLASTWVVVAGLRRASAATRHAVWIVGLGVAAIIPLGALTLPDLVVPVFAPATPLEPMIETPAAPVVSRSAVADASAPPLVVPSAAAGVPHGEAVPAPPAGGFPVASLVAWAFVVWGIGSLFMLARLAVSRWRVGLVTRYASQAVSDRVLHIAGTVAAELGVRRAFRVVRSSWLSVPVNWGTVRPVVVLPDAAETWDDERLRVVLLHELAHVRRWDYATHFIAQVACALHWANPLAWVAVRRAHRHQEQACDDAVLRVGTRSADYATHLVEIARSIAGSRQLAGALAMASPSTLGERVRAILDRNSNRGPLARRTVGTTAVAAALVAVPLASVNLWEARTSMRTAQGLVRELGSPDAGVRANAAWALGRLEASASADALALAMRDASPRVRGVAALSLGESGRDRAADVLLAALSDGDPYVRENAVLALKNFPNDVRARRGVIRSSRDAEPGVRSVTTWVLGEIGGADAAEALARVIAEDDDRHTRGMAISALRDMNVPSVLPILIRTLDGHADPHTREAAGYALGRLADPRAVAPLLQALADPSPDVRSIAARALGAVPHPEAIGGLIGALEDEDRMVRQHAVSALAAIDDPRAVDGILRALQDPVHQVRLTAVWELNQLRK